MLKKSKKLISVVLVFMLMVISILPKTINADSSSVYSGEFEVSLLEDNENVKMVEYEDDDFKYIAIQNKEYQDVNIKIIDKNSLETSEEYIFEKEYMDENGSFKGNLINLENDKNMYLDSERPKQIRSFIPIAIPVTIDIVSALLAAIAATSAVAITVVGASEVSNVLIKKFKDKKQTVIYRLGSGTYTNLTPRPQDKTGLSYMTSNPGKGYTATTMQAINATGDLVAIKDGGNHVSVKPVNMKKMQEWINSRGNAEKKPHLYTKILRSLSVKVK